MYCNNNNDTGSDLAGTLTFTMFDPKAGDPEDWRE